MSKAVEKMSQEQLDKEKKKAVAGLIYLTDNPQDAAQIVGYLASVGLSLEQIENYAEEIKNVTLQQVTEQTTALPTQTSTRSTSSVTAASTASALSLKATTIR